MEDQIKRVEYRGKELILIPTAHVSQKSVELVKQVIEAEKPDSVCIELDEKRFENIKNPKAWEETDIIKVIKTHRVGFMLANLALSSYQKKMAEKLGTTVGGEMLQGIRSAEENGAELVLADRDIQLTFLRIWRKLNLWEKCKLIFSLVFSIGEDEDVEEENLQEMLQGDILESMLADIRTSFPKIGDVLISERDQYLSDKIKNAPGKKVVAVLGAAHVAGVMEAIPTTVDMRAITELPPKKPIGKVVGWIIPLIIVGLLIYGFIDGIQTGIDQLSVWVLWNGGLAALFTVLAFGHPLSILTSFVVAPFSSLNPFVAVGWFTGLVQASIQKPTVKDLHAVQTDIFSLKGFMRNKLLKVLIVVVMANIGSSIGTFVAGADIIRNLFG